MKTAALTAIIGKTALLILNSIFQAKFTAGTTNTAFKHCYAVENINLFIFYFNIVNNNGLFVKP